MSFLQKFWAKKAEMRFHKLRLRNLNALYGEHTIDFDRDVMGASVFLIVGPTGAGKSTLLDAICLALFGQTPRLERRTGKSETDVEHVMSIGTHDCLAELDFSMVGADGTREVYRAVWSMRRAHEKADGTPQRPERSLHRMANGRLELLVSDHRQKFFEPVFNTALRDLSVEDFKRSILLAQGDFAAFLKANASEKASILERVTSTDVYLRLGKRAAERRREAESKWRDVEQRGAGIRVWGHEERFEVEKLFAVTSRQAEIVREEGKALQELLEVVRRFERIQNELTKALGIRQIAQEAVDLVEDSRRRLLLDTTLAEVAVVLESIDELRKTRRIAVSEMDRLSQDWDVLMKEGSESERAWNDKRATLLSLMEKWRVEEPRIRKAEELSNLLELDKASLHGLEGEVEILCGKRLEGQLELDRFRVFESEQKAISDGYTQRLSELGEDVFRRIQAQWEAAVDPQIRQVVERRRTAEERRIVFDGLEKTSAEVEALWQLAETRLEPANRKIARAAERLQALTSEHGGPLGARDVLELKVSQLHHKVASLREAMTLHEQVKHSQVTQGEVRSHIAQLRIERDALEKELEKERTLHDTLEHLQQSLEDNVRKSEQLLALSSLRNDLTLGQPCPLCGSPVHPFCASDELGMLDSQVQKELESLREKLAEVHQKCDDVHENVQRSGHMLTSKRTSLRHFEGREVSVTGEVEALTRRFSQALLVAGYPPLEEYRLRDAEVLAEEVRIATEHYETISTSYSQVKKALLVLNEATQARDALGSVDLTKKRETSALEAHQAGEALRNAEEELERSREDLHERLSVIFAFAQGFDEDIARSAEALAVFMASHREAIEGVRHEIQSLQTTLAEVEVQRPFAIQIQEELVALGSKIEERTVTRVILEEKIALRRAELEGIVGSKNPSAIRSGYEDALRAATLKVEVAARVRETMQGREERWIGQASSLRDRWMNLDEVMNVRCGELSVHLTSLELDEEEARLGILSADLRRTLEHQVQLADLALSNAHERIKVLDGQLAEMGDVDASPDRRHALEFEIETQEASLQELTLAVGGMREKLSVDDHARETLKGLSEEIEAARRVMDVWTRVGGVIGVNEGASFREFAQTLNLQGLVQRANAQLESLHPRYHLVVAEREGLPTLQFDVVDRYQGDVRRPLTTLSGGESFLVSLALALGLAEFRSLDFPVEILLLDEGFGTLDQDALRMAVSTLHRLEARSAKQVAIISHVEALKEMVSVQIRVEPKGFGRSGLSVVR